MTVIGIVTNSELKKLPTLYLANSEVNHMEKNKT